MFHLLPRVTYSEAICAPEAILLLSTPSSSLAFSSLHPSPLPSLSVVLDESESPLATFSQLSLKTSLREMLHKHSLLPGVVEAQSARTAANREHPQPTEAASGFGY